MYRIVSGSTHGLADVEAFIETLNRLDQHPVPEARAFFNPQAELVVARAPGRLDLMGGIADYSGSLVLQLPLREATLVAVQRDPMRLLRIISPVGESNDRSNVFQMRLEDFEPDGKRLDYPAAQALFKHDPKQQWAAYVAGVFLVLMRERGVVFPQGARLLIDSRVPEGKGVSSSAALEVAVMQAVASTFGIIMEAREMALLCQKVENLVVGAPCGVMDQMTAVCGKANRLLALLCQPAELQGTVALPEEMGVWGLDSGERHAVSGADYGSVRVGTFMGYRIIADQAGLKSVQQAPDRPVQITDPHWNGYLANLTPSLFEQGYAPHLPGQMKGETFLDHYGNTTDVVTRVEPGWDYAVRVPTAHPIYEHFRVGLFAELLDGVPNPRRLELLGELMYQSHASYSACGLGSPGTDLLVRLVRAAGPREGLYGAKITGGGSGGTVAVVGRRDAGEVVATIAERYAEQRAYRPYIFAGSSDGAVAFGLLRLRAVG